MRTQPPAGEPRGIGGYRPMWNGRTVSVVLGTYAEKDSIRG